MRVLCVAVAFALAQPPVSWREPSSARPGRAVERRRNVTRSPQGAPTPTPQPAYTLPLSGDCTGASISGVTFTRATAVSCTTSSGALVKLASGQPAVSLDKGLLIEQSGVNYALRSEALDNAAWTSTGSTVTADYLAAPDGTTTADRVVVSPAANATVSQAVSGMTSSALHIASVYAHESTPGAGGTVTVGIANASGTFSACGCYRDDGGACTATSSGTTCAASMTMTGGWVRLVSTSTASGAVTGTTLFLGGGLPGASVTQDYVAWGAQLEQMAIVTFATSYIPTAGTSATRNNAVASLANPLGTTNNFGSVSLDIWLEGPPISGSNRILSYSSSGRTPLGVQQTYATSFFDGTNNFYTQQGLLSSLRATKHVAAGWQASDGTAFVQQGLFRCSTDCLVNSGSPGKYTGSQFIGATLYLGSALGSSNFVNGYLNNVKYYSTKGGAQ